MQFFVFIISIVCLQIVISWVGSSMNTLDGNHLKYAYFYFSDERNNPMTANILINILFPSVVMVFLYDLYKYLSWEFLADRMYVFTISFFIWRAFVICVVLGRREFYKVKYELSVAMIAILISFVVYRFFLLKTESFFIRADELRVELGFAIIVSIYSFLKYIISIKIKQKDILKDEDLKKYIVRKFSEFYSRFANNITITSENNKKWILLFSIMIFENFNRGPEKRWLEYLLLPIRKKETLGIMQVESDTIINDVKSIEIAFDIISNYFKELDISENLITDVEIYEIATRYNNDERYGENIIYIYNVLDEYISSSEKYAKLFFVQDVWSNNKCYSLNEVSKALEDQRTITLENTSGEYLNDITTDHFEMKKESGKYKLTFKDLKSVNIKGTGGSLLSSIEEHYMLEIKNCQDFIIEEIAIRDCVDKNESGEYVVRVNESKNVRLENVKIYGGGYGGILANNSSVTLKDVYVLGCKLGTYAEGDASFDIINGNFGGAVIKF